MTELETANKVVDKYRQTCEPELNMGLGLTLFLVVLGFALGVFWTVVGVFWTGVFNLIF